MRYLPAPDGAAAGGDFYEALELSGGRLGIAVGDMVGHGPGAAAAMGQLRSALRAYALEGRAPARVLQLLSRYADGVPGRAGRPSCTPSSTPARARCATPPPATRRPCSLAPAEAPRYLSGGARRAARPCARARLRRTRPRPLPETSTLILYSDGAIERRGEPLDAGLERLRGRRGRRRWTPRRCARSCWRRSTAHRRDDVALLVARVGVPAIAPLRLWFAARADQLAVVREAMRSWLGERRRGAGDTEILVLAAGELCANAVEHAYAGAHRRVGRGRLGARAAGALTLVVRDRGRWRPPPPLRPGRARAAAWRSCGR